MTVISLQQQKAASRDKKRYVKLRLKDDPSSCIAEPREASQMLTDDPDLQGEDVWMTQDEYDALPEFPGW